MRLVSILVELLVWLVSLQGELCVATLPPGNEARVRDGSEMTSSTRDCQGEDCQDATPARSAANQRALENTRAAVEAATAAAISALAVEKNAAGERESGSGSAWEEEDVAQASIPSPSSSKWGKDSGLSWQVGSTEDQEGKNDRRTWMQASPRSGGADGTAISASIPSWEGSTYGTPGPQGAEGYSSGRSWLLRSEEDKDRYYQALYEDYAEFVRQSRGGKIRFQEHQDKIDQWEKKIDQWEKAQEASKSYSSSRHSSYRKKADILGEASATVRRLQQKSLEQLVALEIEHQQDVDHDTANTASRSTVFRQQYSSEEQEQMMSEYYARQKEKFAKEALEQRRGRYQTARRGGRGMATKSQEMRSGGGDTTTGQSEWGERRTKRGQHNWAQSKQSWKQASGKDERSPGGGMQRKQPPQPNKLEPFPPSHDLPDLPSSTIADQIQLPSASTLRRQYEAVKAAITLQPTQYFHASSGDTTPNQRLRRRSRLFSY